MFWSGWPLERVLFLFLAFAFVMFAVQVGLFHYRGNFRHIIMWGPVLATPLLAVMALGVVFYNAYWLRFVFAIALATEGAAALLGEVLHIRGVELRVGGWELRNVLTGPPLMLPAILSALSLLGLILLYWRGL